eukprot:CAMPEP_0177739944 /NCGR_PEP_ID=MMETSP0484_2-20121128/27303_1 /TAXON_ID=354590 /ORGANISM="Rhodomonas lens, Strain RHODO" /LENGTH=73 /DNA_ID=CAMNT_0019254055 /DNA_START=14 /DNA_END=232 /DNA_ORIENTATION=-
MLNLKSLSGSVKKKIIGQDVEGAVGLRVEMRDSETHDIGTITSISKNGGYVGVRWDSGKVDDCIFTGDQGDFR